MHRAFTTAVIGLALTGAAQAAMIGWNYRRSSDDGTGSPTAFLQSNMVAGFAGDSSSVPAATQRNWNNVSVVYDNNSNIVSNFTGGVDADGNAINTTLKANDLGTAWFSAGSDWNFSGVTNPDYILHRGIIRRQIGFTLSNIPYAQYDVYIYLGSGSNSSSEGNLRIVPDTNATGTTDSTVYWARVSNGMPANKWVPATTIADPGGNLPALASLLYFKNNTASAFTFLNDGDMGNIGVAGVQIVQVPEPSALALLSLAGVSLLRRRR